MNVSRISEQAELEIPTVMQMTSSSRLTQHGLRLQGVPNVDVPRSMHGPFRWKCNMSIEFRLKH
eukprot:6019331-Amphidinium_carterae.1